MTTDAPLNLTELADWVAQESMLFTDDDSPFRAIVTTGAPGLVIVTGENAAGKSLFYRVLAAKVAQTGALPVTLSIRERTGSGLGEMSRMRQAFMFGDETEQSTGAVSVRAISVGFKNLDRPAGSVLALDEPELGLSEGYARALGEYIGTRAHTVPDVCAGVVVVTHSRPLVRGLLDGFGQTPTFVSLDADAGDLDRWLTQPEVRSVEDLLALPEMGLDRFRAAAALLRST